MATVYSTRFAVAAAGSDSYYGVPQGKRAVIKCVTGFNGSASTAGVSIWINTTPVWHVAFPAGTGGIAAGVMVVLNGGDSLRLATSPGVTAQASGFLFDTSG